MSRHQELLNAVETYCGALHNCDIDLFDRVFHPTASLFDADEKRITVESVAEFRKSVAARQSPASVGQSPDNDIIMIDWLSDKSAVVKLRIKIHANTFIDHLNFTFDGIKFMIVAKVWHLESTTQS